MASLPSYVTVLREGFAERRGTNALVRTQMEAGPAKQRRISTRLMVTRSVELLIDSKANYLLFAAWVKADLTMGADWFDWLDPVDGTTKAARLVNGEYTATPYGSDAWRVSATFETWE